MSPLQRSRAEVEKGEDLGNEVMYAVRKLREEKEKRKRRG
jgi:hypothetical protein